jgi:hypothetical protein
VRAKNDCSTVSEPRSELLLGFLCIKVTQKYAAYGDNDITNTEIWLARVEFDLFH